MHPRGCAGAVWSDGKPSGHYCAGLGYHGRTYPWYKACCKMDGSECVSKHVGKDQDCSVEPISTHGDMHPRGCAGAVWSDGKPSGRYCAGLGYNGTTYPWYKACCNFNDLKCVSKYPPQPPPTIGDHPPECFAETHEYQWLGTAPWCAAVPSNCQARGMEYVQSCHNCAGSSCWSGTKVQCKRTKKHGLIDECNPACSDEFEKFWVGTAPWCEGNECGCISAGGYAWKSASGAGQECGCEDRAACPYFGSGCHTGSKVLCLRPKIFNADFSKASMAMKQECTERHRIDAHTKEVAINAMTEIAVAGIKAGKGR